MVHRYVQDNSHGLTIYVNLMFKCVCYMGLGFNGCFMVGATLMDGHYKMNIISGVGYPRSNLVVPLVLCTIAYNIRGMGVVLQVPRDCANPTGKG